MWTRGLAVAVSILAVSAAQALAEQPAHAKIDPRALKVLNDMGTYLSSLPKYAIDAEETVDEHHEESGMNVQMSHNRRVLVVRPNGVHSTTSGDQQRCFYYNGKTVTLHERDKNMYVTIPAPDSIEKMMEEMHEKYGMSLPLAELLMSKPDAAMLEQVDHGYYIGEHTVEGVKCHHIACSQKNVDWQLWVEAGPKPLPRKLVITYTKMDGDPQYSVVIKKWDLNPEPKPGCFDFTAPPGASKMEMPNLGRDKRQ